MDDEPMDCRIELWKHRVTGKWQIRLSYIDGEEWVCREEYDTELEAHAAATAWADANGGTKAWVQ